MQSLSECLAMDFSSPLTSGSPLHREYFQLNCAQGTAPLLGGNQSKELFVKGSPDSDLPEWSRELLGDDNDLKGQEMELLENGPLASLLSQLTGEDNEEILVSEKINAGMKSTSFSAFACNFPTRSCAPIPNSQSMNLSRGAPMSDGQFSNSSLQDVEPLWNDLIDVGSFLDDSLPSYPVINFDRTDIFEQQQQQQQQRIQEHGNPSIQPRSPSISSQNQVSNSFFQFDPIFLDAECPPISKEAVMNITGSKRKNTKDLTSGKMNSKAKTNSFQTEKTVGVTTSSSNSGSSSQKGGQGGSRIQGGEASSLPRGISPQAAAAREAYRERQLMRQKRGTATDPQSVAARNRRERISQKIRSLGAIVPNADKLDIATMLDQAIEYVHFLEQQVQRLSCEKGEPDLEELLVNTGNSNL